MSNRDREELGRTLNQLQAAHREIARARELLDDAYEGESMPNEAIEWMNHNRDVTGE